VLVGVFVGVFVGVLVTVFVGVLVGVAVGVFVGGGATHLRSLHFPEQHWLDAVQRDPVP
jgi:hypothetical protein